MLKCLKNYHIIVLILFRLEKEGENLALKKQTFIKGVLVIMASQVIIKALGFFYRVILTNIKGFQDVGNSYYGSGYMVYAFILAIATTGVPSTISKLVSAKIAVGDRRGAHKIFKTALTMFACVGLFFAFVLFLGSQFIANSVLNNPGVRGTIATLAPAVFFVAISAVFRGYFVGMQNMSAHSTAQILEQIINSIFSVVFVIMLIGNSPEIMAMGSTAATALSTLIACTYLAMYYNKNKKEIWSEIRNSPIFPTESTKKILRNIVNFVIPLSFASVVVALAGMVDLLSVVGNLQKFGLTLLEANQQFGVIVGKVDILVAIPHTFNVALVIPLIPAITAHLVRNEKNEAIKKINFSLKISALIGFPCAAGLTLMAQPIFTTIFRNAPQGAFLLQIEVWAVIFSLLAQTAYGSLNGIGKMYIPGLSVLVAAVIKYTLNMVFIPQYGIIVVPVTTIIYHFVACSIALIVLYKSIKTRPDVKNMLFKPLIATICMVFSVIIVEKIVVNISSRLGIMMGGSLIVGIFVYTAVIILLKTLNKEELGSIPYVNKLCKINENKEKL